MAKRLNDTMALVAEPLSGGVEHSVSVRKVGNGFVTKTSRYNPDTGGYQCSEDFSKKAPRVLAPKVMGGREGSVGNEGLADTKRYLGNDV